MTLRPSRRFPVAFFFSSSSMHGRHHHQQQGGRKPGRSRPSAAQFFDQRQDQSNGGGRYPASLDPSAGSSSDSGHTLPTCSGGRGGYPRSSRAESLRHRSRSRSRSRSPIGRKISRAQPWANDRRPSSNDKNPPGFHAKNGDFVPYTAYSHFGQDREHAFYERKKHERMAKQQGKKQGKRSKSSAAGAATGGGPKGWIKEKLNRNGAGGRGMTERWVHMKTGHKVDWWPKSDKKTVCVDGSNAGRCANRTKLFALLAQIGPET